MKWPTLLTRLFEDRYPAVFIEQDGRLLRSYATVSLLLSVLHLAFKIAVQRPQVEEPLYLLSTVLCVVSSALAAYFAHKGLNRISGAILVATVLWIIVDPAFLDGRGLRTPITLLYVVPILIADFLYGITVGAIVTGVGVVGVMALFYLQTTGLIPGLQYVAGPPLFNHVLFYTVVFSYVHLFNRSFIRRNQQVVEQVENSQRLLVESEKARVAEQQSRLLMSEMHDGIGGALVALKLMLNAPNPDLNVLRSSIDRCLNDLRLTILSVDPEQPKLGALLATMRVDYKRMLESSGITLDWQVDDEAMEVDLPVNSRLHLSRVVQEALTNALKHAQASCITLRANSPHPGCIEISVEDNGIGLKPDQLGKRNSFGLRNMQLRAGQGQFSVSARNRTDAPGFRVHMRWPAVDTLPSDSA